MAATPFTVGPAEFRFGAVSHASIFDDVEEAKRRFLEIRKNLRNRNESGALGKATQPSSSSHTPNAAKRELENYRATLRLLLESESELVETRNRRLGLEKRRDELKDAILSLRSEIELANVRKDESVSEEDVSETNSMKQPDRKRQRYFESSETSKPAASAKSAAKEPHAPVETVSDDLSTVVCPFELLGRCTDATCPHMHLDR